MRLSAEPLKRKLFLILMQIPGEVAPINKPYMYVLPHLVGFLCRFGLKTGTHFAHFGLESGMVFEGTTEWMNIFIVSIPNE